MNFEKKTLILLVSILVISLASLVLSAIGLVTNTRNASDDSESINSSNPLAVQRPKRDDPSYHYNKFAKYDDVIKKDKPMAIVFYTDWCGFCRRSVPRFLEFTKDKEMSKKYNFVFVNGDSALGARLMPQYKVEGYPTLLLLNPKTQKTKLLDNQIVIGTEEIGPVRGEMNRFLEN